ncbi:hypothetical protein [Actinomyces trachealis]|nr:hypothetical protein [Actinomyces trachealis]
MGTQQSVISAVENGGQPPPCRFSGVSLTHWTCA